MAAPTVIERGREDKVGGPTGLVVQLGGPTATSLMALVGHGLKVEGALVDYGSRQQAQLDVRLFK
jgi:hypothetical protein